MQILDFLVRTISREIPFSRLCEARGFMTPNGEVERFVKRVLINVRVSDIEHDAKKF
jgi:hypothetical protein